VKGQRNTLLRHLIIFWAAFSLVLPTNLAFASDGINLANLLADHDPHLVCTNSGESSGGHPGWSTSEAQKITRVKLHNSSYGIYWCAASAPQGQGLISYTVTATLGGLSCEVISTSCVITGLNKNTPLALMATDETGSYRSPTLAIQNSGILEDCAKESLNCFPAPKNIRFASYGNTFPNGVSNCTFAAVANWELITIGRQPDPALVTQEFFSAGGTSSRGLTTEQVFNFWKTQGVGGIHLADSSLLPVDPYTLKRSIDDPNIRSVIASLDLAKGQNIGGVTMTTATYHWVTVIGYTTQGPVIASWGETLQMTWQQWNFEAVSMWRLTTNA